jgi:hypothetical protein
LLVGTSSSLESNAKIQVQNGHVHLYENNNAAGAGYELQWSTNGGATGRLTAAIRGVQQTTGTSGGFLTFSTTPDGSATPLERLRIDSAGRVDTFASGNITAQFATTNAAGGSGYLLVGKHSSTGITYGTTCFWVLNNGNFENSNNSYSGFSDIKLKENIVDANSQWADIKALRVRNYNLKEGQTHKQIGLVAQEVESISPGLVHETVDRDADGNDLGTTTKAVQYSVLYMKAVKALQEAMERIEVLEAKVNALEGN